MRRRRPGARCAEGAPPTATTSPAGRGGKTFRLVTPNGVWELRSPLFALCGSGTTGCHGKFHDGGLRAEWVWRTGAAEEAWWSGTLLREYPPHSPDLYMFGYWAITDRYGNEIIREVK